MNDVEAARRFADSLAADATRPGKERFAEMVARGVIDPQGRVLVRGPESEGAEDVPPAASLTPETSKPKGQPETVPALKLALRRALRKVESLDAELNKERRAFWKLMREKNAMLRELIDLRDAARRRSTR